MDFSYTEERQLIADTLSRWFRDEYDIDARRRAMAEPSGFSPSAWKAMGELGLLTSLLPEDSGGYGGSGFDIALVFEEVGKGLSVEPWLASALLGSRLLAEVGGADDVLKRAVAGEVLLAFAHTEPESGYLPTWVETSARRHEDGWLLSGHKAVALNADSADYVLVSARTSGSAGDSTGISVFLVEGDTARRESTGYQTIDGLRAADLVFSDTQATLLGEVDAAFPAVERTLAAGALAVCAEALGIMGVARDMTLDYLRTREQFGRPIGKFQALQHRMVDVATAIEQSRSLVIKAASEFDGDGHAREIAISAAKHYIGVATRLVGEESIQMHGGIGMAGETPINHYVKRLIMLDHLFGDTDYHLERYIALRNAQATESAA